jgi:hypothetical protein
MRVACNRYPTLRFYVSFVEGGSSRGGILREESRTSDFHFKVFLHGTEVFSNLQISSKCLITYHHGM